MIGIGKSIYWKLLSFFIISIVLASLVILFMFSLFGAQIEIHPRLKDFLFKETVKISNLTTALLSTTGAPLEVVVDQIHREEDVSIRVFDVTGNLRAAATHEDPVPGGGAGKRFHQWPAASHWLRSRQAK